MKKGQSIVEFALVLPLLLTLLCGVIDFGWIYSNQYRVENASYAGARYASLYISDYDESTMNQLIKKVKQEQRKIYGTEARELPFQLALTATKSM